MIKCIRSVFLLLGLSFFSGCFTPTPQKDEIINTVKLLLQEKKHVFVQIIDTFQNIKSHSKDWKIENFAKMGIKFYSFTPFKDYGISFEEYQNDFYRGVDTNTSPQYVEDFVIPANFKEQIEKIYVRAVRFIKDTSNNINRISFSFNSDKFPPITRTVILSYFPQNIPDSLKENKQTGALSWSHILDKNWLIRSIGDDN